MSKRSDFRLRTAERHRALADQSRAKRGLGRAALWAGYGVRRVADAATRFAERVATKQPESVGSADALLIVGHRGAPMRYVENTIEACEWAVDMEGANALEIDLCMTADGEVVLWHDWDPNDTVALARQLGVEPGVKFSPVVPALWSEWRRHVHELTLVELREHYSYAKKFWFFFRRRAPAHVPRFEEFLDWATQRDDLRAVFLDIKLPADHPELVAQMIGRIRDLVDAAKPKFQNILMTPHESIFDAMQPVVGDAIPMCLDTEIPPGIVREPEEYSAVKRAEERGNGFAAVGRPVLTLGGWKIYQDLVAEDLKRIAAAGEAGRSIQLISWTFDNASEGRRMMRLGVQGILTNRPARMRRVARKAGRELA